MGRFHGLAEVREGIRTVTETIGPELARVYLQYNYHKQRCIRPTVVRDLAERIVNGEWKLTHNGIAFAKDPVTGEPVLLDGQHRLHAIIESGREVDIRVTRNMSFDAFKALDCGTVRRLDERYEMPRNLVQVYTALHRLLFSYGRKFAEKELYQYHRVFGAYAEGLHNRAKGKLSVAPVRAAFALYMAENPSAGAELLRQYDLFVSAKHAEGKWGIWDSAMSRLYSCRGGGVDTQAIRFLVTYRALQNPKAPKVMIRDAAALKAHCRQAVRTLLQQSSADGLFDMPYDMA